VGLPDVLALASNYVGRFAQGGGLQDLAQPPYAIGQLRDRYVAYAYDQAMLRSGAVMAAPADIGPAAMLYRHDLLTRAGVDVAELTGSWDSYLQAGLRIRAATGAHLISHAQTLKDMAIRSGLRPGDGLYFGADARPLVTEERFHRAFELALQVRRQGLDARVGSWTNEWTEGLRRGTLATEMSGAWLVGQLSQTAAPKTAGLWRAAQLPDGLFAPYGGAFYALPRRAAPARRALAWDFVQLMTLSAEVQAGAFKRFDAFPALRATHQDAYFDEPVPFLGGQRARLLWREAASRIQATPVHKQNSFAEEVVATELDNVLDRGKSIAKALADAGRLLQQRAHR
jgi:multiple sugar transport system substrate-binding protein